MADSGKKSSPILLILLILSIGLNAYFFYSIKQKSGQIENLNNDISTLSMKVDSLTASSTGLAQNLTSTTTELEEFRGLSGTLDSLLDVAKKDISAKEAKIRSLRKDASKKKELEAEVADLRALKERYLNQIDSLVQANGLLQVQVTEYQKNVEDLTNTNRQLNSTVEKGSILTAGNITATPFKQRNNGKYSTTVIASKTKRVEVCFDLSENKIAKPGDKQTYIRIIGPDGVTLGGAESFTVRDDSTEHRYTTAGTLTYQNQKKNYCINYDQEMPFSKGNYQVEVYTDGYFSGVGAFILK